MNNYSFEQISVGMGEEFTVELDEARMEAFKAATGDVSPIHLCDEAAKARGHRGRVVYGMLCASLFSTLAGVYLPGERCLLHSVDASFAKPVYIGDVLTVSGKVTEVNETFRQVTIKAEIRNGEGQRVTRGIIKAGIE